MKSVAAAVLLLSAACTSGRKEAASHAPERALKDLSGRVAFSDPPDTCKKCQIMVCAHPGKKLPFLGPEEVRGEVNPEPIPAAFDPGTITTRFTGGDHVTFDLSINWNSDQPIKVTSMKLVKHGQPGLQSACPGNPE